MANVTCQGCGAENAETAIVCSECMKPMTVAASIDTGPSPVVEEQPADDGQVGSVGVAAPTELASPAPARVPAPVPAPASAPIPVSAAAPAPMPAAAPTSQLGPRANGARLVASNGLSAELPEGVEVILGRESDDAAICRLLADFDAVSRRHAAVKVVGGVIEARDLGSTNGTYLDGRELGSVPVPRPLPTEIGLGTECTLRVEEQR